MHVFFIISIGPYYIIYIGTRLFFRKNKNFTLCLVTYLMICQIRLARRYFEVIHKSFDDTNIWLTHVFPPAAS